MKLESPAFENEGKIPPKYTCDGQNINPPLAVKGVPSEAASLALLMDDPDVPKKVRADGMWDHWVVFNMPPSIREIREGEEPEGAHGQGTSGDRKYFGPCPPDREHRYYFKLFALDIQLDLPEGASKNQVMDAMKGHIVAEAQLMGRYNRT